MDISKLVKIINSNYIMSANLREIALYGYMDQIIDNINDNLQASFPVISEWADYVEDYNTAHVLDVDYVALDAKVYTAFPSKYLRTVVAPGTAVKFFTNDEEGEQTAKMFYTDYALALASMVRDYIELVPVEFQNNEGGYITTTYGSEEALANSTEGIVISNGDNTL